MKTITFIMLCLFLTGCMGSTSQSLPKGIGSGTDDLKHSRCSDATTVFYEDGKWLLK